MTKTNFTKVEEVLNEGLRKMQANTLLNMADINSGKSPISNESSAYGKLLITLKLEIKNLKKQGHDPYQKLAIDKEELKKFFNNPTSLTAEEWEKVKQIKEKIESLKKDVEKDQPKTSDEDLIKKEQKKHVTKRFNINEKWLPLK